MILRAAESGWRIEEVSVRYHPRVGRSKVTGTIRGTARAVNDMGRLLAAGGQAGGGEGPLEPERGNVGGRVVTLRS